MPILTGKRLCGLDHLYPLGPALADCVWRHHAHLHPAVRWVSVSGFLTVLSLKLIFLSPKLTFLRLPVGSPDINTHTSITVLYGDCVMNVGG